MNNLLILLAQIKSEANIEILFLLLVAAVIGYAAAWFYYKSIYLRRFQAFKSVKHELNNRIADLDAEVFTPLKMSLHKKEKESEHLLLEVRDLKALLNQSVLETNERSLKNKIA
jgi:hypothetical protein